jgi:DNA-binding SARP family transcriptional activator
MVKKRKISMTTLDQMSESVEAIRPIQVLTVGNRACVPVPLLRVTCCGLLTIETVTEMVSADPPLARFLSLSPDQLRGRGVAPALQLLKMLLSQPQRFALKDWLLEQFCQDRDLYSSSRLENIVWQLRSILCPPAYEDLRAHLVTLVRGSTSSGNGYQLASSPLIWTDVDAMAWHVEQAARMERFGDDPLPFWERAYTLAKRGIYLPDELYSDWAAARRGEVAGMLRQSVQALARLYLERHGKAGEEEALLLLRSYWQEHPHEEDVLRPLMELLAQRECYQEALEYYEQLEDTLAEEGLEPDARTRDLAEYIRTKHLQRPRRFQVSVQLKTQRSMQPSQSAMLVNPSPLSQEKAVPTLPSPSTLSIAQDIIQDIIQDTASPEPDEQIQQPSFWLGANVASFDPSRRQFNTQFFQFLGSLIGAGTISFLDPEVWERLTISVDQPAALNQASIDAFERFLAVCWDFCNCGKMSIAQQLLHVFLPSVSRIAEQQRDAARLAAEGLRLQSILSAHQLKMDEKLVQSLQSVKYARLAQEPNTLAASLHELTAAFRYTRQPDALFLVFQEALSFCEQVVPPIRAGIYAGAAAAFAQQKRLKEADFYIRLAYEAAAEDVPPLLAVTDNGLAHLAEYEGMVYLESGLPQKAYQVFEPFTHPKDTSQALPERNRLEMLNYQGQAALLAGEVQQYAYCLERGIEGALAIKSKKRLTETLETFQQMPCQWLNEPPIKQVVECFQLPVGG